MNNNERNFTILLVVAALLPFLSWVLSALGVPCRSILDGEGLRWLARHVTDALHSRLVMFALCCLMMQGVIKESGILPLGEVLHDGRFWRMTGVYAVVFIGILAAAASPGSPLLSVTGGLAGSPLLDVLLLLGWLSFIIFCLCYGHGKREPWTRMLTHGLRTYPLSVPFAIVLSFCWQCVAYMLML